ncbi:hypothetical protein ID866_10940 [Astraeus odoratus]|nr:hypothetical protein ID866_10940 [Astraeus odoratus]
MVYDSVINFSEESHKRMSFVSITYFMLRHVATAFNMINSTVVLWDGKTSTNVSYPVTINYWVLIFVQTNHSYIKIFSVLGNWAGIVQIWLVQGILQLRLYVLYEGSRKILLTTGLAFIAEVIATIVSMTEASIYQVNPELNAGVGIDSSITAIPTVADTTYINYSAVIAYEGLLFALALWAAIRRFGEGTGFSFGTMGRLKDILIEGNVGYFFVLMVNFIAYVIATYTLTLEWVAITASFLFAAVSVVGCYLILHIRKAVESQSSNFSLDDSQWQNHQLVALDPTCSSIQPNESTIVI